MRQTLFLIVAVLLAPPAASQAQDDKLLSEGLKQLASLAGKPLYERAPRWVCKPSERQTCDKDGCAPAPATVSIKLNFQETTYSRCDEKGCDDYPMDFASSGIFTTATPQRHGSFIKVVNDGSEYMEVATLMLQVYVYFGACKPDGRSD